MRIVAYAGYRSTEKYLFFVEYLVPQIIRPVTIKKAAG